MEVRPVRTVAKITKQGLEPGFVFSTIAPKQLRFKVGAGPVRSLGSADRHGRSPREIFGLTPMRAHLLVIDGTGQAAALIRMLERDSYGCYQARGPMRVRTLLDEETVDLIVWRE